VACFFERPWSRLSPKLSEADQAWLLSEAAFYLRSLGRLTEALEPMRARLEMAIEQKDWINASIRTGNLSELELMLGQVSAASSERSVEFADRSGDAFERVKQRVKHADALHHAGRRDAARGWFVEAGAIQAEYQREYPRLYGRGPASATATCCWRPPSEQRGKPGSI